MEKKKRTGLFQLIEPAVCWLTPPWREERKTVRKRAIAVGVGLKCCIKKCDFLKAWNMKIPFR